MGRKYFNNRSITKSSNVISQRPIDVTLRSLQS